ncbi:hypothetical protein FB45DRAFT_940000 [Roridomyces roridus]|uniref:BTB domain-containing protein n=1 Tax=Roridomyces roridus TaxID=1738132 RepID=A0AAD7FD96_9AGAR|nr:hypothetical protein FB45DRAFT_940000 [Roridomyces roridus]
MEIDFQPHRIPELWFEDGNIVIQAGNSQFRVHRGILAACSPVFQDMLSVPQPPESELVEGCPLVRLSDHSEEVAVFLKAIFEPNYFMPFPAKTEYSIIRGCLRLAHKYEVEHLRLRALVHLSSRYRTSLGERDTCNTDESSADGSFNLSQIASWPIPGQQGHLVSVIQFAREVEALWILPDAFYRLSSIVLKDLPELLFSQSVFDGQASCFNVQDQKACLYGHTVQTKASATHIAAIFSADHPPDCTTPAVCRQERICAINSMLLAISTCASIPLDIWCDEDVPKTCGVCLTSLQAAHRRARQEFWNRMPSMYGLPPWEELEKMKTEAIGVQWWLS